MKIVIVCRSHNQGGAAIVSLRLMRALRRAGHDARMLVLMKPATDVEGVGCYASGLRDKVNFLAERLEIFLQNGFSRRRLFMVDTASWGADISTHPWVKEADVVNLNWINQGAMSMSALGKLAKMGKRVVWTMHDMWNCTGICHHAYDCQRYTGQCGCCPMLGGRGRNTDLSTRVQRRKRALYEASHFRFVAVSHWLADRCRSSSLMHDADISVINNAFPIEKYECTPLSRSSLDIAPGKTVLVMGAARLDDHVKGLDTLIAVTRYMRDKMPGLADRCHLVLYGGIRNGELLQQLALPYTYLGKMPMERLNDIYRQSDVVICPSRYETLGGTLVEGMASGCRAVSFTGGQNDVIDHLATGYLAQAGDVADFARGIEWAACHTEISRESQHAAMDARFSEQRVAEMYLKLFGADK